MKQIDTSMRLDDIQDINQANRVRFLEAACKWIAASCKPSSEFAQAARDVSARLVSLEGVAARPISEGTMRRLYYKWLKAGKNWRALVDMRTVFANRANVRTAQPAFRAHLALLASKHKRCLMSAIKELYREWREGKVIPGYEGLNYKPNMPIPHGWSVDNLMGRMPDKRALAMTRQGVRAAADMLPQVFFTRAGLWPLARVQFDDVWLDCKVQGYGPDGRPCVDRPLQLGCLDYFTGKRLSSFTKVRAKAEDGHSIQLKEDEMLYLLCDHLLNTGYSKRGTTLVVENGTAAISKEVEELLGIISNGCIKVERSGIQGVKQPGAFAGRGAGNPREKASLESLHNLLHNEMDGIISQVGKDRCEPEQLYGLTKMAEKIARVKGEQRLEAAEFLTQYAPTLAELSDLLVQVVARINNRTDHNLEGWEECGFITMEFSYDGQTGWKRPQDLPENQREFAASLAAQNPNLIRRRKLSPQEAWQQSYDKADIVRFTPAECVALMGTKAKFKLKQRGGSFLIASTKRHHQQLLFETAVTTADGFLRELPYGQEYYGILNPFSETLFVLDAKDRVLGIAAKQVRANFVDDAAKLRVLGRAKNRVDREFQRMQNILAPQTAELQAIQQLNEDILEGRPIHPQDRSDARVLRKLSNKAETRQQEAALAYTPKPSGGFDLPDDYTDKPTFLP